MTCVQKWSGRETRALREALRLSIRDFAARLGVTNRTVSKWEAGGANLLPRPDTQAILDTALRQATEEAKQRFLLSLNGLAVATQAEAASGPAGMVLIPAGDYLAGPDGRREWLAGFWLDLTPTTNDQYAAFVADLGHRPPSHWPAGSPPAGRGNHPVVYVDQHDASAYAKWAGKRLPTAPEWEKAARGTRGARYPWGDSESYAKCNVRETAVGETTPVHRYHSGVSPFGVYDMCGNTWEWCQTETSAGRYVLKGSAFTSRLDRAAPHLLNDASATMFDDDTGFRCARSL